MSGPLSIPAGSVIYLHSDIVSPFDPTADTVDAALVLLGAGDPQEDDWQPGEWTPGAATARVLVGPGTQIARQPGTYRLWFRIHDTPEIPELDSGLVVIT
jgi:hypothetical protein